VVSSHFRQKRLTAFRPIINKYAKISLHTKLIIYKSFIEPTCRTHDIELWGNTKISNINKIQTHQSKTLRSILNTPQYTSNDTIHNNLHIPIIKQTVIARYTTIFN